jgi:hypothetical protein
MDVCVQRADPVLPACAADCTEYGHAPSRQGSLSGGQLLGERIADPPGPTPPPTSAADTVSPLQQPAHLNSVGAHLDPPRLASIDHCRRVQPPSSRTTLPELRTLENPRHAKDDSIRHLGRPAEYS